jgi:predicted nucleic acid-binding protein
MASKPRLYWDTSVFIEYFNDDEKAPWYQAIHSLLATAKRGRFQICTSVLSVTEVVFVLPLEYSGKTFQGGHAEKMDRMWNDYPAILTVRSDMRIARTARSMHRWAIEKQIKQLNGADYVHIATAIHARAGQIHTTEPAWFPYTKYAEIPIGYPEAPPEKREEPTLFEEKRAD